MYVIVRNMDGTHYTTYAFGYGCKITSTDPYQRYLENIYGRFYLVLSSSKDRLVKQYVYYKEDGVLIPRVIPIDGMMEEVERMEGPYNLIKEKYIGDINIENDEIEVAQEILDICVQKDADYQYQDITEIKQQSDIYNLLNIAQNFHDARIEKSENKGDVIHIYFLVSGGYEIEITVEGDAIYTDPNRVGQSWREGRIFQDHGCWYLVDGIAEAAKDLDETFCIIKGKRMTYRIILD